MTSYMYNPSKKVTEILSKFLEFEPSELELGIWSGDLQLKNVNIRQEAIHPLLNKRANKPHTNPLKKAPLHMKLVSGKVGHMRFRIPWKRLVWGQGSVQLEVSDVMIVLSLQSREETEEQRKKGLLNTKKKKVKKEEETGVSQAYRDAKQRRLRDAEKRHMQGMPVALYLDNVHRKNSIEKDAAKAEATMKQAEPPKKPGRLDKWLKNKSSDLFWRFFAGIQGSITKARIVVVQDGVEVGCIVQSIEVSVGKEGTKVDVNMGEDASDTSEGEMSGTDLTPQEQFEYESGYEDGEHVDKTIKQQGMGLFIRKVVSMAKVPQTLRFSSSVSADDYILRPVDLNVSFSFFYPYPADRRKKRAVDNHSQATPTTAASTTATSGGVSVADSATNASAKRRGKRDRAAPPPPPTPGGGLTPLSAASDGRKMKRSNSFTMPSSRNRATPEMNRLRAHRRMLAGDLAGRHQMQRFASSRNMRTAHSSGMSSNMDNPSVQESAAIVPDRSLPPVPRFDCKVSLNEIRIVFCTRHYELLNYFVSTVMRMQNGRPDQYIRNVRKNDTTAFQRKFLNELDSPNSTKAKPAMKVPTTGMLSQMLAPLTGFATGHTDEPSLAQDSDSDLNVPLQSPRSKVCKKWWKYAIGSILWEVRKRKHLTTNFRQMYISFDWNRQRYKRKEYVEMYIAVKLDKDKDKDSVWQFEGNQDREEQLLRIEDELPLEQILLYRAIARSMRVRGLTIMPENLSEMRTQTRDFREKVSSRKSTSLPVPANNENFGSGGETTLLSLVQKKFQASSKLRLPGGIQERFKHSSNRSRSSSVTLKSGKRNDEDDVLSSEAAQQDMMSPPGRQRRNQSLGFDSATNSDSVGRRRRNQSRKGSLGLDSTPDVQAGNFYSGGLKKDSLADGRTIRTFQRGKDTKSTRLGHAATTADGSAKVDDRMRVSFSFHIKCIDIMVVEEEYLFDIAPDDELRRGNASGRISTGLASQGDSSGEESASEVSELSVLTDDERYFNEEGEVGVIAEEVEEEEGARLFSTDFLLFGLPENPLFRLTLTSFGCSARGRSGGDLRMGISIRKINAASENETPVFSMGLTEKPSPIAEVNLDAVQPRQKSYDSIDLDFSSSMKDHSDLGKEKGRDTNRAVSAMLSLEAASKHIQCDFSRISVSLNLEPVRKLLRFYSRSDIKYPSKHITKSSRDVARKFMVYKTAAHAGLKSLNTAIRIHGLEVKVPFSSLDTVSEASDVDSSHGYDNESVDIMPKQTSWPALVFAANTLELYSGSAVDEMCAAAGPSDAQSRSSSLWSGSLASRRSLTVKSLDMLDIVELTAVNDSFSCVHWVATMGGVNCNFQTSANSIADFVYVPIDVEVLLTVNETSLLETESPQNQVVVEVSPVHAMLSEGRLDMLRRTVSSLDFGSLNTSTHLGKKRKPDPPRIEILSRRIQHSLDLKCRSVQLAFVKDVEDTDSLTPQLKEVIMEECLGDFLSVVSCFDFSLPNEEALSSAMQVCIGRLVGLGLTDDEAWGCTNSARLNFLDDIALMRRAQTDVLVQLSSSIRKESAYLFKAPLQEEEYEEEDEDSSSGVVEDSTDVSSEEGDEEAPVSSATEATEDSSDDDSADSADIVETTLHNAVEKTVATFAPLLQGYHSDFKDMSLQSIFTVDMPMGFRMSVVKLFYDQHVTVLATSLVVTNSAGIELLTLVPHSDVEDGDASLDEDQEAPPANGISYSLFDLDKGYDFGKGGIAMSSLAGDDGEDGDMMFRERSKVSDIDIGELELLFSSRIYEDIIDEMSQWGARKAEEAHTQPSQQESSMRKSPDSSTLAVASSVSMLFTSDQMVPFSRLTLERMCYKNKTALEGDTSPTPSWSLVSESAALQNLTPEGQYYPDTLSLLCADQAEKFPFQIRYFKSPDPWQFSNRVEIEFDGFRLYLMRQFIYEMLHYFVYDKYGLGRLKKKYSKDVRDIHGNQKPPLLYTVKVCNTSVICPRCSTSSDMACFEVEEARIAVSYIPETFRMPTETSTFEPSPQGSIPSVDRFSNPPFPRSNSFSSTTSEYHECMDEPASDSEEETQVPVSAFSKDLHRRLTITLGNVRVFTVIAKDKATRDTVESPLFRFFHAVDGRAADGKLVYKRKENAERQTYLDPDALTDVEKCEQQWEEISTDLLNVEVFADYVPHMRLLIGSAAGPLTLNARLSQFALLITVWDSNMQEMPTMFPFFSSQVGQSAKPPVIPDDFPAYGTEEFVAHMEDTSIIRSEICCLFLKVAIRCTFDPPGHFPVDPNCFQYFEDPACPESEKPGLVFTLEDAVVHVINDFHNVRRIGIGASYLELVDERRQPIFQRILATTRVEEDQRPAGCPPAWADVGFGLRNDVRTLGSSLPVPVQATIFMIPGWSLITVGAQSANGIMHELSWIWLFLDYFKSYWTDIAFGNPGHQAQRWVHKVKNSLRKAMGQDKIPFEPLPGTNVDFRLWVCQPILCLPCSYHLPRAPCLRIESRTGLWYRYKSVGDLSSQEVATTDLNLYFLNEFQPADSWRRTSIRESVGGVRPLVESLSFGLRYDSNNLCNHKDVSVLIPYAGEFAPDLTVAGPELEVRPIVMSPPTVCKPVQTMRRTLGPKVCEITCIIEVLPVAKETMVNFFSGPSEINEDFQVEEEDKGPVTFSVAAKVRDMRVFAIDPILGVQLPVAVASLGSMELTATKFSGVPLQLDLDPGEAPPDDLQVAANCHLWADYFKLGLTRSWEPLLEPLEFTLLFEQSKERGKGFSIEADSAIHVNLSGALLQILGETVTSFSSLVNETFGEQASSEKYMRRSVSIVSPSKGSEGAFVEDAILTGEGREVEVLHEIPKPLKLEDRAAFSLRNLTGQKVRIHQQTDHSSEAARRGPAIVTYLSQSETMGLTFAATISIVKNLTIMEVPYPGLPNSTNSTQNQGSLNHAVDLQVPGFKWIQGIKVDTFGRRFETLTPRSPEVLTKVCGDWRLKNAMMLLTEVGLDSGGRLVTVRSLFEIRNSTTHPIKIVFNPDPKYYPVEASSRGGVTSLPQGDSGDSIVSHQDYVEPEEIEVILPGDTYQVPTLLLEKSLQMSGSHLGCLWLCPDTKAQSSSFWEYFRTNASVDDGEIEASFCSRPVQLARLVYESSVIFQSGTGEDIGEDGAKSGVQVSCPTLSRKGGGRAPFCYAIEVGRSPLVNMLRDKVAPEAKDTAQQDSSKAEKKATMGSDKKTKKNEERVHGPVAYTLSIHSPLVIVNLLPEGGRFELMHAVRKTVVWYADLQPGQQVPVHSVGLDAPLLLLVNLGFCRTPVGEGALVHHGADSTAGGKEHGTRFKSIGKAALKGTKQFGKTLATISDTQERRALGRLAQVHTPQFYHKENRKDAAQLTPKVDQDGSLGLDTGTGKVGAVDGKVHSVETVAYSSNDVATETTVVDGIGQRLTLKIENTRGGGGQRRVSLFCPFWIVNTTEHSLRYKQDKGREFVSGTVVSPDLDGSKPVDGSNRNYRNHHMAQTTIRKSSRNVMMLDPKESEKTPMNSGTIFAGTPGALATAPGRCNLGASELAELIDKEVPLEKLAHLAFMFNFHDEGLSIGHQMLSVQLCDGTGQWDYVSDWSRGFSLDSVGFSQIVSMNAKEGRALELSVEVNVAPGFLSSYTKIVRLLPRYVVLNRLERSIRLWQDSSVYRSVNEERGATVSDTSKEARKWRYHAEDKHHREKINQYEMLYGRPATITDASSERAIARNSHISTGTTAHRSALYISTVHPHEVVPFLLPDTRAERQLRIDFGGTWNITSSFSSDLPGEHTLRVSKATDLRLLNHVSTRAAPKYKIFLPPPDDTNDGEWDGELGVFFETEDWGGDRRIIVKGTKRGKYAFNHTDIHVGDELLRVDGVSIMRMSFVETMKLIKDRISQVQAARAQQKTPTGQGKRQGVLRRISVQVQKRRLSGGHVKTNDGGNAKATHLTLTFRTLEERLRKLRLKASHGGSTNGQSQIIGDPDRANSMELSSVLPKMAAPQMDSFNVEMKSLHNTMFVVLKKLDKENPAFQIQNRSINHVVFYRQRGCDGHPWNSLLPGESLPYSWEEPMKSKKLTVRVSAKSHEIFKTNCETASQESGSDFEADLNSDTEFVSSAEQERHSARAARLRQALSYQFVDTEERGCYGPPITVRLEEIGYRTLLPVPAKEGGRASQGRRKFLNCEVDTDGGTRLLIVSDDAGMDDDRRTLNKHLETLKKQMAYEEQRIAGLHSLEYLLSQEQSGEKHSHGENEVKSESPEERIEVIENNAKRFIEDYPEDSTITSRHQVVVEVIEAVGLNPSDFIGSCNPYCEIFLKGRSKSRKYFFQKRLNKRKTYFIEKSLNPKWTDQVFVFDVPDEAVRVTRGHLLQVKVRNFRLAGQHPIMGQAAVHFGSLRNQQELVGWYPLAGRSVRSNLETAQLSDVGKGSIKLRVQWVHTTNALITYFILLSQARLDQLARSEEGMKQQLTHATDADERKREAKGQLNAGRIQKLSKLGKRAPPSVPAISRKPIRSQDQERENVVEKLNQGINTSLTVLKDTLRASRDRYLYALYYQTAESKRQRQLEVQERQIAAAQDESVGESTNVSEQHVGSEPKSPGSVGAGSRSSAKKGLEQFFSQQQRAKSAMQSPQPRDTFQSNKQSLGDFFAKSLSPKVQPQLPAGDVRPLQDGAVLSPRRPPSRRTTDVGTNRLVSHRRLSLDIDDTLVEEQGEQQGDPWQPSLRHGQALYDGLYGQEADLGISDLISVSTDVDEEAKRRRNTQVLMNLGFVFHEFGDYFHEDHLPRHFRRSLFANSMEERKANRLYRPRFAVGTPSTIRHFKTWQAAGTLHWDPEIEVRDTNNEFFIHLKDKVARKPKSIMATLESEAVLRERLAVPDNAPMTTKQRASARADELHISRLRFERAAKRRLGAVLNPGGWLTVRPITALNLPDAYTGMFVKLRYGSEVLVSQTVDAKVTPRWAPLDLFEPTEERGSFVSKKPRSSKRKAEDGEVKFNENDLHVHVEPQQTSGFIKISVVAERANTKSELGVLQIPLGAAIGACLDDDEEDKGTETVGQVKPPMYTRWFPLMNPRLAVPVEGDMGLSARPTESEQPRDSMFQQYFAPCIQLSLMWWPDNYDANDKEPENGEEEKVSGAQALRGPKPVVRVVKPPSIQSYFNADIGRISAALIDSQKAVELLSFTALDIDVRFSASKTKTRIGVVVGWIQLDHQDKRAREPVVFAPTPSEAMQPTLQVLALKDNLRTKSNIVSYEYIGVALQEMDLTVEESWLFELWDFFMGVMRRRKAKRNTVKGQRRADFLLTTDNCFTASDYEDDESPSLLSILEGSDDASQSTKRKIYIEQLILGLIKVNLSYVKGKKQSFELTDEGARTLKNLEVRELPGLALAPGGVPLGSMARVDQSEIFVKWSQHTYDEDLLGDTGGYNLPGIIAAVFPSVVDAPIRLQGKAIDHVFESGGEILSSIKNFYVNETLKQVYKIIGSLDFVGNPTIIFSSFVSGVRDLVAAPTSAFLKSPTNFNQVGLAVGKGTISLFSHSASGIFGFAARMSATAGQAAAILSLDTEYREWHRDRIVQEATNLHREWKRRGVQSVPEMVTRPVGDILLGIAMGASGLFLLPYKGLKSGGTLGMFQGVAVGTVGVVAKPLVGVLDAITHFSATVHDIAKSVNVLERRYQPALKLRLPYSFGPMNILSPFDPVLARSVHLLSLFPPKLKRGQRRPEMAREIHVHSEVLHMEPGVETYAIATTLRVVLIKLKKDNLGSLVPSFGWGVELGGEGTVTSTVSDHGHNGVALTITRHLQRDVNSETAKESKGWRGRRASEPMKSPTVSSAMSVESAFSDEGEDLLYPETADEPGSGNEAEPTFHDHGATTKGDEVRKWFTVLAEYQHRQQLTSLHNAVCSIVGDFNSVVIDRAHEFDGECEGVSTFGIFSFERDLHDGKGSVASNATLIDSLEYLPWMHEAIFHDVRHVAQAKQKAFVATIRQGWRFSTDLAASRAQGGPAWLIDARARAMFVSRATAAMPVATDRGEGSIGSEINWSAPVERHAAVDKATALNETETSDKGRFSESLTLPDAESLGEPNPKRRASSTEQVVHNGDSVLVDTARRFSGDHLQATSHEEGEHHFVSDEELIQSMEGGAIGTASSVSPMSTLGLGLHPTPIDSPDSPARRMSSLDGFEDCKSPSSERLPAGTQERPATAYNVDAAPIAATQTQGSHVDDHSAPSSIFHQNDDGGTSRMDRMESVMEQLVILNAQQTQRSTIPTEIASESSSAGDPKMAQLLMKEVADLRAQVQARADEDAALRSELSLWRQQLAERREQRNERAEKPRRKIPEILRFGSAAKKVERERIETLEKQGEHRPVNQEVHRNDSERVYTAPLSGDSLVKVPTPRPAGSHSKAARRSSGASTPGANLRTGRRLSGNSSVSSGRAQNRGFGDNSSMDSGVVVRKHSEEQLT